MSVPVRALAATLLAEVEEGGYSDRLLQAREKRLRDVRDRRFLHALVLGALRWQGALDARLEPLVRGGLAGLQPVTRALLRAGVTDALVLGQPAAIAVSAAVEASRAAGAGRAAGLVNAVLRRALAPGAALDERLTLPFWLQERWAAAFGADAAGALVAAVNRPAHGFLVPRPGLPRTDLAAALAAHDVVTEPALRHPEGLVVRRGAPQATPFFARGDFTLLDEAAALVARLAEPDDERPLADLAAAPGGKATLLAQRARGPCVALDLHAGRTRLLARTLAARVPAGRVAVVRADAGRPPLRSGAFGTVLLDAPCSGTGTLRRRPEKRHRLRPEDVAACAAAQRGLLAAAAELVAAGGALVYAVCSLEPEEGREQVRQFLAARPEFRAEDPAERLGPGAAGLVEGDPPLFVTRPDRDDLDGFVGARLRRGLAS